MKCTNNNFLPIIRNNQKTKSVVKRLLTLSFCVLLLLSTLTGCAGTAILLPYTQLSQKNSAFSEKATTMSADKAAAFASDLCVVNDDVNVDKADLSSATVAGLFSLSDHQVLYAKNIHKSMYPASLTKVMTALVALKEGNQDDNLTATSDCMITESGAQVCGLVPGDTMTLDQALRIMLLYSANDVAVMIADQYGSTKEGFADLMNQEARSIGATETHFVNPNGLNDAEHYLSGYDMYLIFNEACKYDLFREIIAMSGYQTQYTDKNGEAKTFDKSSTNGYITGSVTAPTGITVIGGKTGTTRAAGHCLVLLARDTSGKEYIALVMEATSTDALYADMNNLLSLIGK